MNISLELFILSQVLLPDALHSDMVMDCEHFHTFSAKIMGIFIKQPSRILSHLPVSSTSF